MIFGSSKSKLLFGAIPKRSGELDTVKVNNKALVDLGWKSKYSIEEGMLKVVNYEKDM